MIIIAGPLFVHPLDRDDYLASTATVAALARQAPGCLDFVQAADPLDPARINIFERWETDADVESFRTSGDEPEVEGPELIRADVRKYRIAAVEAP